MVAVTADREDTDQQVPGVGDRRVRQQPLDVGLGHREDRTDDHRQYRDPADHQPQVPCGPLERDVDHPEQRAERGHLRAGRHERGDRGRCTLVHVRGPDVERYRRRLEQQADREQREAQVQQDPVVGRGLDRLVDRGEVDLPGVPVDHRDAEQEERRGERAEQEVLQRRLLGQQPAPPGQPAHQVQRQREDLQCHEHGQQVVRRDEQHHAAEGEQQQRVHLGAGVAALGLDAVGLGTGGHRGHRDERPARFQRPLGDQQQRHDPEHGEGTFEEQRRTVHRDRTAGRQLPRMRHPDHHDERGDQRDQRQPELHRVPAPPPGERLDQYPDRGGAEQDQHGRQRHIVDLRQLERLLRKDHLPPPCATVGFGSALPICENVACTAGLTTSSTGFG